MLSSFPEWTSPNEKSHFMFYATSYYLFEFRSKWDRGTVKIQTPPWMGWEGGEEVTGHEKKFAR